MSMTDVKNFYERLKTDQNLVEEMLELKEAVEKGDKKYLADETLVDKKIISIAKNYGFEFSEEELKSYAKEQLSKLSAEDLLNVTGGSFIGALLKGGLALVTSIFPVGGNAGAQRTAQQPNQPEQVVAQVVARGDDAAEQQEREEESFEEEEARAEATAPQKSAEELKQEADRFFKGLNSNDRYILFGSVDNKDASLEYLSREVCDKKFKFFNMKKESPADRKLICLKSDANPLYRFAKEHELLDATGTYLCHVMDDGTVEVTPFLDDNQQDCEIPSTVDFNGDTRNVVCLMDSAFYGCEQLTSFTLSGDFDRFFFGFFSLGNCVNLRDLNINGSVTSIAFLPCSLVSTAVSKLDLTTVSGGFEADRLAFCDSNLKEIKLADSLDFLRMGISALWGCSNFKYLELPKVITDIALLRILYSDIVCDNPPIFISCLAVKSDIIMGRMNSKFGGLENLHTIILGKEVTGFSEDFLRKCKNLKVVLVSTKDLEEKVRATLEACGRSDVDVILTDMINS